MKRSISLSRVYGELIDFIDYDERWIGDYLRRNHFQMRKMTGPERIEFYFCLEETPHRQAERRWAEQTAPLLTNADLEELAQRLGNVFPDAHTILNYFFNRLTLGDGTRMADRTTRLQ